MNLYITVAAGLKVSLRNYIKAVKLAKANPEKEFDRGLTCWWPCTGADIVQQFTEGVHDRINQKATRTIDKLV